MEHSFIFRMNITLVFNCNCFGRFFCRDLFRGKDQEKIWLHKLYIKNIPEDCVHASILLNLYTENVKSKINVILITIKSVTNPKWL